MVRKIIDLILTVNLVFIVGYIAYLWHTDILTINFNHEQDRVRVEQNIYDLFRASMQQAVVTTQGSPTEGFEPQMFLAAFPGLAASDFNNVAASIGYYQIIDGQLEHKLTEGRLVHSAAGAITRSGMSTLLDNVATRLQINLDGDGTITEVMDAISVE